MARGATAHDPADETVAETPAATPVRGPSKIDQVLALLRREEGATLAELMETTGWLPHTTRAALTGLRKKGHVLAKDTRKSSDEGLEQDFNSLDAQREACAVYVASQASEGWTLMPAYYDDGGISGGTLERPALRRLLADVAAGHIDTIVVYKVDRLTRSLLDFAKLVEALDKADTSFVSVTQSFNTTTSMGRLTLNMLLSFAQFEREVTAERIRDKIAAS
ncbi:MAG: recombinase family protein, partial [Novosphingobium sp.]